MKYRFLLVGSLLALLLTACGGDDHDMGVLDPSDAMSGMDHSGMAMASDEPMDAMGDSLEVIDPWGRNSPMAAANGAFYMTISNGTDQDEKLLSAAADVCGATELHEMYDRGEGVMGMREVLNGFIEIPAGQAVRLQVGGLHVMCLEKETAFDLGQEIPLTLTFENAGEMQVVAEIREGEME